MNNMNHDLPSPSRIVWLDIVRLTAMLMVIGVHCIDPFYISPTLGTLPEYKFWASVYGSLFRPSVPLFAMMTGLLLLPVGQQPLGVFYKKRIFRVLFIPVVYRSSRASEIHYRRFFLLCTRK